MLEEQNGKSAEEGTKTEVDIGVPVHIYEARTFGFPRKDGERSGPADHPQHRYAAMQRLARPLVEFVGFEMGFVKEPFFGFKEFC